MTKRGKYSFEILVILLMALFSIPLYLTIINTFKPNADIVTHPLAFPIHNVGFTNIINATKNMNVLKSYGVTILIGILTLVYTIVFASLAAYAIARNNNRFFRIAYWIFAACILMPIQSAFIPLIFILKGFNLYNNILGISMVYIAILSPFCIFMYTGFIRTIPRDLEEAAMMDGCSRIRIFFQIIFPLLKPVTASLIIMQFIYIWNDLLLPLVVLNSGDYPTVSLQLYNFLADRGMSDLSSLFGGIVLVLLPVVILFLAFQRYFVKGLSSGSVKS